MSWRNEIIIGYSKTKRYIRGPFDMCGDPETLRGIAHQILNATREDRNFGGGWITILPCKAGNENMTNLAPVEWDD